MSLREAMSEVADQMDEFAADLKKVESGSSVVSNAVAGFVRQIRSALKAAGPEPAPASRIADPMGEAIRQRELMRLEAAKAELANQVRLAADGYNSAEVVGGPMAGTDACPNILPIEPKTPVGAFLPLGNAVYELREDRKLHYHEGQTKRYREHLAKQIGAVPE